MQNNTDDRISDAVNCAVIVVKNRVQDSFLTAMNKVAFPRIEMAVRLITGSLGNEPNSIIENPDRRVFTGDTKNTQLRPTSNRLDLNIEQDEIKKTPDIDTSRQ